MEQIIHARERILDPEFLLKNALSLFGPQRADAVRLGGVSQEPFLERFFFRRRQGRGPTALSLGDDRFEAVIPIPVEPPLHESSAAAQGPCDRWGIVTFDGQENGSIAIPLFGVSLLTTLLTQLHQVLRVVKLDLHPTGPPVFTTVSQMPDAGATLF
jgi:hypothetical protein